MPLFSRRPSRPFGAIDRRSVLRAGLAGLPALLAPAFAFPRLARASGAPAKSCIWLWLNGGPSHIDTFDPKSGTREGGPFKAIRTRVKGLEICEHLPLLAERADRFSIIRSMTSREGNHDRARFLLHSGYTPSPTVAYPSLGGWMSHELERAGLELPRFVSVGGPSLGAGFLGVAHAPFRVRAGQSIDNIDLPTLVDRERFERRRGLLASFEASFAGQTADPKIDARRSVYDNAVKLMQSSQLGAFDVDREPENTRSRYGDNEFGRGCLVARRLVEVGVPFVEVTLDGWDTHKDNFERTRRLMTTLDGGASSLFDDLEQRGLLGETVVVVAGEFGRTPTINANDGRDHHPKAWSVLLGGGGARGGIVYGRTSPDGANVVESPVRVADLFATLVTLVGLDPDKTVSSPAGRPISLTDRGKAIRALVV